MTDRCPKCKRFVPYTAWGPLEPLNGEDERWELECSRCGHLEVEL